VAGNRFWQDFELSWAKWTVFRFVFFGLQAVDAFWQVGHAPRYGAGGFNVQQLPGALLPEPSRVGMTFVYGALCVLFALIAQGAVVRWALPLATALYGYAYFVSQLDSYQHHYLIWLVLVLLCLVPTRPDPSPGRVAWVRAWSLRLLLVQLGLVYAWAAFAKLDGVWLDGSALARQVHTGWIRSQLESVGYAPVAIAVLAVEITLAGTVWLRRAWPIAVPLGFGMHVGIELIGLDIGLFSYFMMALYLLLLPDAIFTGLVARLTALTAPLAKVPAGARLGLAGVVIVAALIVVGRHPLPLGKVAGLAIGAGLAIVVTGAGTYPAKARTVALAIAPLALLLTVTEVANDHFRMWAGSARRMGLATDERAAYQGLIAVDPTSEYGHYYLGRLELTAGKPDVAIEHFHAAEASEPRRARSYQAEAAAHLAKHDRAAADDAKARMEAAGAR